MTKDLIMRSVQLSFLAVVMTVKEQVMSAQNVTYPRIRQMRHSVREMIFQQIDAQLDQLIHTLNQFRRFRLYLHPSKVSIEEMNEVEDSFLRLADRNRLGNQMNTTEALRFYIELQRVRYRHLRVIDRMAQAINIHQLLRHAFLLDR